MSNGKFAKRKGVATKAMFVILAVVLIVGISVGGTLAWLTATSGPVTNTFTVGDINITLTETTPTNYKIVPGGEDNKDPTITVLKNSENCYVYVTVDNTVVLNGTVVATPNIDTTNWIEVQTTGTKTLYRYKDVVPASTTNDQPLPVFTKVVYSDTITKGNINTLANTTIVINGFAHQSDNTTLSVANDAAIAWAFPSATP